MTNKELADKAINIKGKDYVQVKDRIVFFNDTYEKGQIHTEILPSADGLYVVKATIVVGDGRSFTGHSQAKVGDGMVNATSALENAETSAVGRALAMMGIGIIDSVASADEMNKAKNAQKELEKPHAEPDQNDTPCPKCGSPLRVKTTKNGKTVTECSTRTWSAELGSQGCEFMVWGSYEPPETEEDYPFPEEEL